MKSEENKKMSLSLFIKSKALSCKVAIEWLKIYLDFPQPHILLSKDGSQFIKEISTNGPKSIIVRHYCKILHDIPNPGSWYRDVIRILKTC